MTGKDLNVELNTSLSPVVFTDRETCGLMFGSMTVDEVVVSRLVRLKNRAPDPTHDYRLNIVDVRVAERKHGGGMTLLGPWHTHVHPDDIGWPTWADYQGLPQGSLGCIFTQHQATACFYSNEPRSGIVRVLRVPSWEHEEAPTRR